MWLKFTLVVASIRESTPKIGEKDRCLPRRICHSNVCLVAWKSTKCRPQSTLYPSRGHGVTVVCLVLFGVLGAVLCLWQLAGSLATLTKNLWGFRRRSIPECWTACRALAAPETMMTAVAAAAAVAGAAGSNLLHPSPGLPVWVSWKRSVAGCGFKPASCRHDAMRTMLH
jgi:hypothetical protein